MKMVDHWQLPDGVEEVLPAQAEAVERLRRQLLDLFHAWGYRLVIPPLVELPSRCWWAWERIWT